MARFLSPHAAYSIQVIEGVEKIVTNQGGTAQMVQLQKPVIANFEKQGLLDYEQEVALMNFTFSGLPEGVNPLTTVSVFDTEAFVEAWPVEDEKDGLLIKLDERLRRLAEKHPSQLRAVDPPAKARPWPSYDKMSTEEILRSQEVTGFSPESIRLYELENQNREEIINAMLSLENPDAAIEDDGVVAEVTA